MYFANSEYLLIIIFASLALVIFYLIALKRRTLRMQRFAEKALIKEIAPYVSMKKKIFKIVLVTTALILLFLTLARPQWGFEWQEIKRKGLDILIAIDCSKSMLARDVKPNRLERSKFAVRDLVRDLGGDRIGLIAFAGSAFLQCPLTIDYDGFLLALDDLNTSTIPRQGTGIERAIEEALKIFKGPETKYKVLVLITDGDDLEGNSLERASEAARLGIRIYCVGVGTEEGDLIPVIDETGQRAYLADKSGNVVKTRLNEDLLKQIAISTGGNYIRASQSEFGLTLLYDKSISKLERRDIESKMKKHYQERFQLFLALALVLLCAEPLISEVKGRL